MLNEKERDAERQQISYLRDNDVFTTILPNEGDSDPLHLFKFVSTSASMFSIHTMADALV